MRATATRNAGKLGCFSARKRDFDNRQARVRADSSHNDPQSVALRIMFPRETYIESAAKLDKFYGRRPDQISEAEVQRSLLHLLEERKLAHSSALRRLLVSQRRLRAQPPR